MTGSVAKGKYGVRPRRAGSICPVKREYSPLLITRVSRDSAEECPIRFAPSRFCPSPTHRKHLIARQHNGCELAIRIPCHRWSCEVCSLVRKQTWLERLHAVIVRDRFEVLYLWAGDAASWSRDRRALARCNGKFLRVAGPDRGHSVAVFTSPLASTLAVEPAAAFDAIADALAAIPLTHGRPVTATKRWLPAVQRPRKYHFAGDILGSDANLEATLVEQVLDGTLEGRVLERGAAAVWRFPASMPDDERQRVRDRLFGTALPVNAPKQRTTAPARRAV